MTGIRILLALAMFGITAQAQTSGGCASFAREAVSASACQPAGAPGSPVKLLREHESFAEKPTLSSDFEESLFDPAFTTGVRISGQQARIGFHPSAGAYLVEVIITGISSSQSLFQLVINGAQSTPWRAANGRTGSLIALVDARGAVTLEIRTTADHYTLSALRWMPRHELEQSAPRWLERAQNRMAQPIYGRDVGGAFARASHVIELLERARHSQEKSLRAIATSMLARARYWLTVENGPAEELSRTGALLSEAHALAPQDALLQQTLSAWCRATPNFDKRAPARESFCDAVRPVPWQITLPADPAGAPDWAVTQRRLRKRLNAITDWWVSKRQQPNGELGGGWSDDVEILRYWGPLALGFGDETAAAGLQRLGDGVWGSGYIKDGYEKRIRDVEHGAEPVTDTLPLMIALAPEDERLLARLRQSADCLRHWLARAPDGHWRFRGAWFNCSEFDPLPERAIDVNFNTHAAAPALWLAYLTRDTELIGQLARWGKSWVAGMRETRAGKPPGIFPPAVQFADGSYLIRSERWWQPNAEWEYFNWNGLNQESIASLLLALHDLTGGREWLDAAGESFAPVMSRQSEPALAEELRKYPQAFLEWRRRSNDARYDRHFDYAPEPADRGRKLQQARADLTRMAREAEEKYSYNLAMFTSEALFTDRIYYPLPVRYRQYLFGGEAPRGERYPTFAVTWPGQESDFARAVLTATDDRLEFLLYGFAAKDAQFSLRSWKLAPGSYRWTLESAEGGAAPLKTGSLIITRRAQLLALPLPARRELILSIVR